MIKSTSAIMLLLATVILSSCSQGQEEIVEPKDSSVSEEMMNKLNTAQDINDKSTQLNEELDSLLLILEE